MKHKFLKLAGVKTEEEFYKKFPDEKSFFKAFPKAKHGIATTPAQQYEGLNNPNYSSMEFPMQGNNVFRGLDNGEPVMLQDSTGKKKILKGNKDTTVMKGTVKEKLVAQSGVSLEQKEKEYMDYVQSARNPSLKKYLNERPKHSVEGRYSGLEGNDSPTLLESIKGNIDYFNNNTPDSNVYRPEFMHHSVIEKPIVPIAKCGKSVKGKMKKAQMGLMTDEDPKNKYKVFQQDNTMAVDNTVNKPFLPLNNNKAQFKELAAPIEGFTYTDNTLNWSNPSNINGGRNQPPVKPSGYEETPIDISAKTGYDENKRMIMPTSPNHNRLDLANNPSKNISSRTMGEGDNNANIKGKPMYGGQGKVNLGDVSNLAIGMAQMLMGPEGERRKIDNTLAYNPYAYGTGSQAIAKKGKSIKAQQGKTFTPQYNFPTGFNNTKPDYADSISYKIKFNETPKLLKSKSRVSATGANYINPEEHINDTDLDWVMNSGNPYVFNKNPNLRKSIVNEEAAYSDYLKQYSNYYNSETGKLKPSMKAHAKSIGIPMEITPKYKQGGNIKPSHQGQGLMTYEGGNAPKVSENMFDGGTHLFTGDSHEKGGITSSFNGQPFEAEGGEPFSVIKGATPSEGVKGVVYGDKYVAGTNMTYKKVAKILMGKEQESNKYLDKGTKLVNEKDPTDKFERLAFNSGRAMMEGAATKLKQLADSKAHLAELQEAQLELDGEQAFAKHGKTIKAQNGYIAPSGYTRMVSDDERIYPNALEQIARQAAVNYGIDPELYHRIITQESQYNPTKTSRPNKRTGEKAYGLQMFTLDTGKRHGLSEKDLLDDSYDGYVRNLSAGASEFKTRLDSYNGDTKLALIDYNGGPKGVKYAKKLAKKYGLIKTDAEFTGDIAQKALATERVKNPSPDKDAWKNQSSEYVDIITEADKSVFPQKAASFHKNFYNQATPDFSLPTPQLKGLTPEEIAAMDGKKPNVPNQPAKGSDPFQWQKVEPWKINPTKDKLELSQVMGETAALFDRPDFVEGQRYNPDLYTPYQVSFQDRINQNSKTFNALQSTLSGNPEALATMAGQQYSANNDILAEEFRTNQAIANDITNKNVSLLNDAKLKNISLIDQQYVRQNQAKSVTDQNKINALNSISSKILQKKASNNLLNTYKNMFPHYDFDKNYQVVKQGPGGEQYVTFPEEVGSNPFATTDKKTQTTYENGVEKSKKETIEPTYVRDKKYLELQKQLGDLKFNGSIIKKYKGSN